MSWRTVFADDLLEVRRSRLGWGVAGVVFALTGGIGVLLVLQEISRQPQVQAPAFEGVSLAVGAVLAFVLPFVAMLASYSTIIAERESGSIRFLLGFPNSRLDAYAGKYLSRGLVYVLSTVAGFAVLGVVGVAVLREPAIGEFLLFLGVTLVYGLVFVGFGLAASAVLESETSVTAGIISVYVAFRGGWMVLQWGALRLTQPREEAFVQPHPEWYYVLGRANPMNAYAKLVDSLFNEGATIPLITGPAPSADTAPAQATVVDTFATGEAYAVAALLAWLVVVPVFGFLRFRNKDLL